MKEFIIKYWLEVGFTIIVAILSGGYKVLSKRVQQQLKDQKSLCNGTKALLRNEIIRSYDKYTDQGWIPLYGLENVLEMYSSYHCLNGNGSITKLVGELKQLPAKDTGG